MDITQNYLTDYAAFLYNIAYKQREIVERRVKGGCLTGTSFNHFLAFIPI